MHTKRVRVQVMIGGTMMLGKGSGRRHGGGANERGGAVDVTAAVMAVLVVTAVAVVRIRRGGGIHGRASHGALLRGLA